MDIKLNFDKRAFRRILKREVKTNLKREYERGLNRLAKSHKGRDADEVERAIRRELGLNDDGDVPDGWIEAVQAGRNITMNVTWD